jgi:hypothetical protein
VGCEDDSASRIARVFDAITDASGNVLALRLRAVRARGDAVGWAQAARLRDLGDEGVDGAEQDFLFVRRELLDLPEAAEEAAIERGRVGGCGGRRAGQDLIRRGVERLLLVSTR